jgi:hypothetical protein
MRVDDIDCVACRGTVPCKGGGNLRCKHRNPHAARIALILDSYGGIRTIVGPHKSIAANTRHDELVRIVPGLLVHEPIAWNDIPVVIERARLEFEAWLNTRPNLTAEQAEAVSMYRLRQLEHEQASLDLGAIVET